MKINERNLGTQKMINDNLIYGDFIRNAETFFSEVLNIKDDIIVDDIEEAVDIARDNNMLAVSVENGYSVLYHRIKSIPELEDWISEFGMDESEIKYIVNQIAEGESFLDSYDIEMKYGYMITTVPIAETLDEFNFYMEEMLKLLLSNLKNDKILEIKSRIHNINFRIKFASFLYYIATHLFYFACENSTMSINARDIIPTQYLVSMVNTSLDMSRDIAAVFLLLSHRFDKIVNKDGVVIYAK